MGQLFCHDSHMRQPTTTIDNNNNKHSQQQKYHNNTFIPTTTNHNNNNINNTFIPTICDRMQINRDPKVSCKSTRSSITQRRRQRQLMRRIVCVRTHTHTHRHKVHVAANKAFSSSVTHSHCLTHTLTRLTGTRFV